MDVSCIRVIFTDLLSSEDLYVTVEFNLINAEFMVLKIIELTKFVLNIIKADYSILELFVVIKFTSFITAASKNSINSKEWNSHCHENHML